MLQTYYIDLFRFYCFLKKMEFSKTSSNQQILHYNFDLSQNSRKNSKPLYQAKIYFSIIQKWVLHDLNC